MFSPTKLRPVISYDDQFVVAVKSKILPILAYKTYVKSGRLKVSSVQITLGKCSFPLIFDYLFYFRAPSNSLPSICKHYWIFLFFWNDFKHNGAVLSLRWNDWADWKENHTRSVIREFLTACPTSTKMRSRLSTWHLPTDFQEILIGDCERILWYLVTKKKDCPCVVMLFSLSLTLATSVSLLDSCSNSPPPLIERERLK